MGKMFNSLYRWFKSQSGQVAITMAIAAPVLFGVVGLAIDYVSMSNQQAALQGLSDTAAIAAAREMALSNSGSQQLYAVVKSYANQKSKKFPNQIDAKVLVDEKQGSVTVTLAHNWTPIFAHFFNADVTPVTATSKAQLAGTGKVCVLGLHPSKSKTIGLKKNAKLTGNGCGVFSNSTNNESIKLEENSSIIASIICSAGGVKYNKPGTVIPPATTDCPVVPDPLRDRAEPPVGGCTFDELEVKNEIRTLSPGTYCGGLKIKGNSVVTFSPGVYVIKDGKLEVSDSASMIGINTGFYFTGKDIGLKFDSDTTIDLTAPKTGDMVGILFFEERAASEDHEYEIKSDNARQLLGTIYLPMGKLKISSNSEVADESAYTAIVVYNLKLEEGPNLVLNSDYDATTYRCRQALRADGLCWQDKTPEN